jgi:hypothetical protein
MEGNKALMACVLLAIGMMHPGDRRLLRFDSILGHECLKADYTLLKKIEYPLWPYLARGFAVS